MAKPRLRYRAAFPPAIGISWETWASLTEGTRRTIYASCLGKRPRDRGDARAHARRLEVETKLRHSAYPCPFGEHRHWHAGKTIPVETMAKIALAIRDLHGNHPENPRSAA